jgi:hypothetical protein
MRVVIELEVISIRAYPSESEAARGPSEGGVVQGGAGAGVRGPLRVPVGGPARAPEAGSLKDIGPAPDWVGGR